jgi:hypothetical protein
VTNDGYEQVCIFDSSMLKETKMNEYSSWYEGEIISRKDENSLYLEIIENYNELNCYLSE